MRTIHAAGLTLEPQLAAHAGEMFTVLSDLAIYEFENQPPPSEDWLRERYTRLESRSSVDGSEQWLNWVVRLFSGELAGFVQATVQPNADAHVAYAFGSRFWGRGIGRTAVRAMLDELCLHHGAHQFFATFKIPNGRSMRLLEHLGFTIAPAPFQVEADEMVMSRPARLPRSLH